MKMSKYYADYLLDAMRQHGAYGWDYKTIAEKNNLNKGVNDIIRGVFNRFVKIGATCWDVRQWLNGEYLYCTKAIEYHIRFVCKEHQLSAARLADELGIYDVDQLRRILNGMAINNADGMSYTWVCDLDTLTIKKAWHKNSPFI